MDNSLIRVTMIVQCLKMKSPKEQRRKFDETMEAGFWQVGENVEVINHNNLSVSTTSYWSRDFKAVKKQKQILKSTRSLLVRAAEYADILELKAEIIIGEYPPETFSYHTDQPSDYFKNKTWR